MRRINLSLLILALCFSVGCTKKSSAPVVEAESVNVKEKSVVEMETSLGRIVLELDGKAAPKTVANFLEYAKAGFYDGTIFHRVIDGFMIQGGGFEQGMKEKATRAPIVNEASNGLPNAQFTIAMARTNNPDSATAQFFINLIDNKNLNYIKNISAGYAVFGKVVKGEDIVQKIGKVATTTSGYYEDVPKEPVIIKSVKVIEG